MLSCRIVSRQSTERERRRRSRRRAGVAAGLVALIVVLVGLGGGRGHALLREAVRDYYALVGDTGGPLTIIDRGSWTELDPGLEMHEIVVTRPRNLSALTLVALRIDPHRYDLAVAPLTPPGSSAAEAGQETGAAAVINGGYFDRDGRPLGLLMSGGEVLSGNLARTSGRAVFGVRDGRPFVTDAAGLSLDGVTEALQTTPLLVRDGLEVEGFDEPWRVDRRAAVCIDGGGHVIFAVTDTLLNGLSFSEMAHLMSRGVDRGGLGCRWGMNLDGGTSAQMWVRGHPEASVEGYTDIPTFLVARPAITP